MYGKGISPSLFSEVIGILHRLLIGIFRYTRPHSQRVGTGLLLLRHGIYFLFHIFASFRFGIIPKADFPILCNPRLAFLIPRC